ncbi:GMC family oxidoreductase [Pseudomonadota bacterium]
MAGTTFPNSESVDFVIIGSGAAGGVMARELSVAGFTVVVLEQGPHLKSGDFRHDEWAYKNQQELTWGAIQGHPQTFRSTEDDTAEVTQRAVLSYAHNVGGSSVHFAANYWRFREVDFIERSLLGPIAGTNFADWPITYQDLEPYYTKVDWEIGVSGIEGPSDPPRSKGYPCPPMPVKSPGVLLERAGKKLGYQPYPAPVAILSQPHNGRAACMHCGFCWGFGCEASAKSSSMVAMIPQAEATGRCEIRTYCTASRIETNEAGRATGVVYWDTDGVEHFQKSNAVVLSANGAESPRLLLLSESSRFPDGLANSSGMVGKNLMFNGWSWTVGLFEQPVNAYKSIPTTRVIHDFYSLDPSLGHYGGGGIDARSSSGGTPIASASYAGPPDGPQWGEAYKQSLREMFTHTAAFVGHTTSLPLSSNNVSLDPTVRDRWGRPALRTTYQDHPHDISTMQFFKDRSDELMAAAGASRIWGAVAGGGTPESQHLLGTCRMGNDPGSSVVDKFHRSHDVPNLFICDGSSLVTSGRGQPTMTIQALAFRAADHIAAAGRRGDV